MRRPPHRVALREAPRSAIDARGVEVPRSPPRRR